MVAIFQEQLARAINVVSQSHSSMLSMYSTKVTTPEVVGWCVRPAVRSQRSNLSVIIQLLYGNCLVIIW